MRAGHQFAALALGALSLSACATAAPVPVNVAASAPAATEIATRGERDVLFVALSGGGARAASFSLGALQELRDTRDADGRALSAHIALMSSVSGGSITAAYYGLHGDAGLDGLRAAYLDKDWDINLSPAWPPNWVRAWNGGLNGPNTFASWLDAEIFSGADVGDFSGPHIWLNATDTFNGVTFSFTPLYFNTICADLGDVRVADAVAASMAFPGVFKPILVESHAGACDGAPDWVASVLEDRNASATTRATARALASYRADPPLRWLHLSDGGVIDNLGLSILTMLREVAPDAASPLAPRDAARLRRLTVIVVNAENARNDDWRNDVHGPNGPDVINAITDSYIELGNRASYDRFREAFAQWQSDLIAWRCALSADERALYVQDVQNWRCDDLALTADMISFRDLDAETYARVAALPTRVYLPPDDVDALIAAGREGVRINAAVDAFAQP